MDTCRVLIAESIDIFPAEKVYLTSWQCSPMTRSFSETRQADFSTSQESGMLRLLSKGIEVSTIEKNILNDDYRKIDSSLAKLTCKCGGWFVVYR